MRDTRALFQQAAERAGIIDRTFRIAGHSVQLRFAGPALEEYLIPALAHLETDDSAPALKVLLWDAASTGCGLPPPLWAENACTVRGEIQGLHSDRIHLAISPGFNGISLLDSDENVAVFCMPDAWRIPYYEYSSPVRTIFHWWLGQHGRQLVHAGVVGTEEGGVLIAGRGGSGKSVTALTCLCAGMQYAGDDYTVIDADARPYAYSLYSSAKLNARDVKRFPELQPALKNPDRLDEEKAVLFIRQVLPERVSTGMPIRAILLPRVLGTGPTRVSAVSAATSLRYLAPSTIFQLPRAGRPAFECIAELVKDVPGYVLELGGEPKDTPGVIRELLAH